MRLRRGMTGVLAVLLAGVLAVVAVPDPVGAAVSTSVHRTDGVEGRSEGPTSNPIPAHVWDIQTIGSTMYVAGRFTHAVEASGSWPRHEQRFLAAFDADTGRFVPDWRPVLDGPVWTLDISPTGALLAGGDFSQVNGQPHQSLVALDPETAEIDPGFYAEVERLWSNDIPVIRGLHRAGDDLYLIGNFTHVRGGARADPLRIEAGKVARVHAGTGRPDPQWRPVLSGRSGWAVAVSTDGQRVHLGGEFSYVNGEPGTHLLATVDATDGALVPGWNHGPSRQPVSFWPVGGITFDLGVWGDNLFIGGANDFWEMRDSTTGASLVLERLTNDGQAVEVIGDRVYIGRHGFKHTPENQFMEIDARTGTYLRGMTATIQGGDGGWAAAEAPDGCLWVGGDFGTSTDVVGLEPGRLSWVGRVARLCDPDGPDPPPAAPPLVATGSTWRYWADGTHPTGWTKPDFADEAWASGPARLGFGGGDEATTYPAIGADGRRILSAVFRRGFDVPDPAAVPYLDLRLNVDDGATVWLNGHPVVAQNMPTGTITADTWALEGSWATRREFRSHRLASDHLVAGTNVLAVSVHQNYRASSQMTFELSLAAAADAGAGLTPVPDIQVPGQAPPPPPPPRPVATELVPRGATWRYRDDGTAPASSWRASASGDADWPTTALPFDDADRPRDRTAYFRHTFTAADPGAFTELVLDLRRDDGAVVYLNGIELTRQNLPGGELTHQTAALEYVFGLAEARYTTVTVPSTALRSGENLLAVAIHQAPGSQDLRFGLGLTAR